MKVFRIQNMVTGLFKKAGARTDTFNREGKLWANKRNFALHVSNYEGNLPKDCVVVEYELVEKRRIPLEDWNSKATLKAVEQE
jgi:hypothetical protein